MFNTRSTTQAPSLRARARRVLITSCSVLVSAACSDSTEPRVATTLQLEPQGVELAWGRNKTATITATILDQHGTAFSTNPDGYEVLWSGGDNRIATVDGGTITAVDAGETMVIAQAGSLSPAHVQVRVLAPDSLSGELSFQYSGSATGSFSISSTWPFDPEDPKLMGTKEFESSHPNWTVAYRFHPQDATVIVAQHRRPDGLWDTFELIVPGGAVMAPRTTELGPHTGEFVIGVGGGPLAYYLMEDGSVTFSSASPQRLQGTFAVRMADADGTGDRIELRGPFNVPMISGSPW